MPNNAVDFRLDVMPGSGDDIEYSFRFGRCGNFKYALATVKRIPWAEREYEPEDNHRWTVRATESNLQLLREAFDNFGRLYELAKNQLPLPL